MYTYCIHKYTKESIMEVKRILLLFVNSIDLSKDVM